MSPIGPRQKWAVEPGDMTTNSQIDQQTERLLQNPALLHRLNQRLTNQGFIGDVESKLKVFLIGLTINCDKMYRICAYLCGESGAGKTKLLRIIERYFPKDLILNYHRITAHAVDYLSKGQQSFTMDGKILIIKEMGGMQESTYTIKILADPESDELCLLTVQGPPGQQKATEIRLPGFPVIFTSTTKVEIDPQLVRRFDDIHPRDDSEQTRLIKEHKARCRIDREYKKKISKDDEVLKALVSKFQSAEVVIPFANEIQAKLPNVLLARSDIDHYFNYISIIALLHRRNRLAFIDKDGQLCVIASPIDHYYTWILTKNTIAKRLKGIRDSRTSKIYEICQKLCGQKANGWFKLGEVMEAQISEGLDYAYNTIYKTANSLINKGFLMKAKDSQNRRTNVYTLTSKAFTPFEIAFPDEDIEKKYLLYIIDKIAVENPVGQHTLPPEMHSIFKNSLQAFDLETGEKVTRRIISPTLAKKITE